MTETHAVTVRPSALSAMARRFSMDPSKLLGTLKNTVFKGASDEQLGALVIVANEHGLNPFTREIYAFPDKSGGIQAVVGVDGWLRIINSNDKFDGVEFIQGDGECTCILYVKGREHPVKVTEYLEECRRNTDPWKTYPRRMLRHKALIQAARIGFGFAGLKDEDDAVAMHPASATIEILPAPTAKVSIDTKPQEDDVPMEPPAPAPAQEPPDAADQLANVVCSAGFTFDQWRTWAIDTGVCPEAEQFGSFDEVPQAVAKRLVRARGGMLQGLKVTQEAKS